MKKLTVILLLFAPLAMSAQYQKRQNSERPGNSYGISPRQAPAASEKGIKYLSVPGIGFGSMPNHKLNEWAASYGRFPSSSIVVVDAFNTCYVNGHWQTGMSFGFFFSDHPLFGALNLGLSGGRSIIHTSRFQSSLNANLSFGRIDINGIVPRSISNPDPAKVLFSRYVGIGFSNSNYVTVCSWGKGASKINLALGVEYGINFIAQSEWKYGYRSRRSHTNAVNISVPEVPALDSHFTYCKFLLSLRF